MQTDTQQQMFSSPLPHPVSAKLNAALQRAVENLDVELCRFENNFTSQHCQILWAEDFTEVHYLMKTLFKGQRAKQIDLCDGLHSQLFDEIGLSYFLEDNKIQESSEAPIQLFQADLMVAETGQLLFCNKPVEYVSKLYNNKINIIITTLERMMGSMTNADAYGTLCLCREQDPQQHSRFTLFGGCPNNKTLLFVIDNSRSKLLSQKSQRRALTCIQCGRCEAVCPVDQMVGKSYYNNVFTGPIGRVVLPHLETVESYGHIVWNCNMCGRCDEVCPQHLPLREMIVANRNMLLEQDEMEPQQEETFVKMKKYLTDRIRLNRSAWMKQQTLSKNVTHGLKEVLNLPKFAEKTFNQTVNKSK